MKTFVKLVFIFVIAVFAVACNHRDDNNDLYDYQIDIATVQNPYNLTNFFFKLDNNKLMWVDKTVFKDYAPKDGQRIIANYTLLSDKSVTHLYNYVVQLNDAYNVLTKGIFNITKATQDSIGNDSISIEDMWIGSDYINVQFSYPGYNKTHFINLVNDTSKVFTDGKIHLFFRHNSNSDEPAYIRTGIVSFNIKSLQTGATSSILNLVIHVNVPNQAADKTYDLTYDFIPGLIVLAPKHLFPAQHQQKLN
jgi:hypothetical protein